MANIPPIDSANSHFFIRIIHKWPNPNSPFQFDWLETGLWYWPPVPNSLQAYTYWSGDGFFTYHQTVSYGIWYEFSISRSPDNKWAVFFGDTVNPNVQLGGSKTVRDYNGSGAVQTGMSPYVEFMAETHTLGDLSQGDFMASNLPRGRAEVQNAYIRGFDNVLRLFGSPLFVLNSNAFVYSMPNWDLQLPFSNNWSKFIATTVTMPTNPYGWSLSNSVYTQKDPVSLVFIGPKASSVEPAQLVLIDLLGHTQWTNDEGGVQYFRFVNTNFLPHDFQRASGGLVQERRHYRLIQSPDGDTIWGGFSILAIHKDVNVSMFPPPGCFPLEHVGLNFDIERDALAYLLFTGGLHSHSITTSRWVGNSNASPQCNGSTPRGDGYTHWVYMP